MKNTGKSILAIVVGIVLIFVLSILMDIIMLKTGVMTDNPFSANPAWVVVVVLSYRIVINVFGCYMAARLAPERPMRHAMILGFIGLVLSIIGSAMMWQEPYWYPVALIVLALPCAYIGGKLRTS
jgi:hypothetical protein